MLIMTNWRQTAPSNVAYAQMAEQDALVSTFFEKRNDERRTLLFGIFVVASDGNSALSGQRI